MIKGAFHAKDGIKFQRGSDGSVVATRATPEMKSPDEVQILFHLDANTWASVIAHVSTINDDAEAFSAAQSLHGTKP